MTGEIVDWKEALIKAQEAGSLSLEAYVIDAQGSQTKVYLHCHRLTAAEIEKARRHIKKSASDKGHKTRDATLLACEWLTVLTTLGPAEMSGELIFELYRIRWQIELYIKRLKSILKLGKLRASRGSKLARVHLLAKMLYALLIETVAVERLGRDWTRMSGERRATWFRVWKMLNEELTETIIGTAHWREWEWRLMLTVIAERRRKRKLQRLSRLVIRGLSENSPAQVAKSSNQMSISLLAA